MSSSNIIPSWEADAPPPVHCILPTGKSGNLRAVDEQRLYGVCPLTTACRSSTSESLLGDMDDDSQLNFVVECRRTFTQADDFQDLAKSSSTGSALHGSSGLQSENTEEQPPDNRQKLRCSDPTQIEDASLRESSKESSHSECSMSALSPQSIALSVAVPSVLIGASDSPGSCPSPQQDDDREFMVSGSSERSLCTALSNNSTFSGANHDTRSSCKEIHHTDDDVSVNTTKDPHVPLTDCTVSTSFERADPETTESRCRNTKDEPRSSASRCMIYAQLSVTSHPIGTTSVARLEPLLFCGFSAEVDSLHSHSSLDRLQPRFEQMSRELAEFRQYLAAMATKSTATREQSYSALPHSSPVSPNASLLFRRRDPLSPISGRDSTGEIQRVHNKPTVPITSVMPSSLNVAQLKHESNRSVNPSFDGVPVYGRWNCEPYYYAGFLRPDNEQTASRHWIFFEDGSKARLRTMDIVAVHLLPTNTQVYVDWDDSGEYRGNCRIIRHTEDCERPYEICYEPRGVKKLFRRKNVAVHNSEVFRLRHRGLLPSDTANDTLLHDALSVLKLGTDLTATTSPATANPPIMSDISLSNMVFGKRERKRKKFTDENKQTSADTNAVHKRSTPCKSDHPMDVSSAKRSRLTAKPTYRHAHRHSISGSLRGHGKRRVLVESDEETLTQPMSLECRIKDSSSDEDRATAASTDEYSVSRLRGASSSANFYLRRSLSRSLNIPIPSATLFTGWTIVFTGRFHHGTTSSSGGSTDVCGADRATLEKLITACGGRLRPSSNVGSTTDKENVSPAGHSLWNHVALVANEPCRTLKYVQALATLGRVPLLRTKWVLDVVRREHMEQEALVDTAEVSVPRNKQWDNGTKRSRDSRNWPLRLLLDRPGRYELPRGYADYSGDLVSWSTVPTLYRSFKPDNSSAPSLFRMPNNWPNAPQDCTIAAIVTNDQDVFGPSWLNILKLASGYSLIRGTLDPQTDDSVDAVSKPSRPIPVIPMEESVVETLASLAAKLEEDNKTGLAGSVGWFVLVDKNGLTTSIFSRLRSLPFLWVTCDYFIQSLICGELLDPQSSPLFTPSFE